MQNFSQYDFNRVQVKDHGCDMNQRDSNSIHLKTGLTTGWDAGRGPLRAAEMRGAGFRDHDKITNSRPPFQEECLLNKPLDRRTQWPLLLPNMFF